MIHRHRVWVMNVRQLGNSVTANMLSKLDIKI